MTQHGEIAPTFISAPYWNPLDRRMCCLLLLQAPTILPYNTHCPLRGHWPITKSSTCRGRGQVGLISPAHALLTLGLLVLPTYTPSPLKGLDDIHTSLSAFLSSSLTLQPSSFWTLPLTPSSYALRESGSPPKKPTLPLFCHILLALGLCLRTSFWVGLRYRWYIVQCDQPGPASW